MVTGVIRKALSGRPNGSANRRKGSGGAVLAAFLVRGFHRCPGAAPVAMRQSRSKRSAQQGDQRIGHELAVTAIAARSQVNAVLTEQGLGGNALRGLDVRQINQRKSLLAPKAADRVLIGSQIIAKGLLIALFVGFFSD